jgi:hypothetical protein
MYGEPELKKVKEVGEKNDEYTPFNLTSGATFESDCKKNYTLKLVILFFSKVYGRTDCKADISKTPRQVLSEFRFVVDIAQRCDQ